MSDDLKARLERELDLLERWEDDPDYTVHDFRRDYLAVLRDMEGEEEAYRQKPSDSAWERRIGHTGWLRDIADGKKNIDQDALNCLADGIDHRDAEWVMMREHLGIPFHERVDRFLASQPERVPPEDLKHEPCEVDGCKAPDGECATNHVLGWYQCPRGPCRNWQDRVERRKGERRASQPEPEPWMYLFHARAPRPGAHLRADGEPCQYTTDRNGFCNKCGFLASQPEPVDPEPPIREALAIIGRDVLPDEVADEVEEHLWAVLRCLGCEDAHAKSVPEPVGERIDEERTFRVYMETDEDGRPWIAGVTANEPGEAVLGWQEIADAVGDGADAVLIILPANDGGDDE